MSIKFKGIKKLGSDHSINNSTTISNNENNSTASKKSKGIRGLLNRARSIPSPGTPVTSNNNNSALSSSYADGGNSNISGITLSATSSPLHGNVPSSTANQPGTSVPSSQLAHTFPMSGSQEELQRVLLPSHQSSHSVISSPSPSASLHRNTPLSTGGSPSPQMRLQQSSNSANTTPLPNSSSVFSVSNMCSPINDVIIEEEYEDPAEMGNGRSPVETETEIDDSFITRNGIYSEPCDTKNKSSSVYDEEDNETLNNDDYMENDTSSSADQFQSLATLSSANSSSKVNNNSVGDCANQPQPISNQPGRQSRSQSESGESREAKALQCMLLGPQGIDHHPASPFEPLSKGLSGSCVKPSKEPLNSNLSSDESPSHLPRRSKSTTVPSSNLAAPKESCHPTYEEAWDVKMSRLGVDMSRLASATPPDNPPAPSFPPPPPPPFEQHASRLGSSSSSRMAHNYCSSSSGDRSVSPLVSQSKMSLHSQSQPNKKPIQYRSATTSGRTVGGHHSQPPDKVGEHSEYDYAYNKNWKMNVQKNLSVSLNIPADTPSGGSGGGVAPVPTLGSTQGMSDELNSSNETSPNSPGNYEEPWDKKQGSKIISQLSSGTRSNPYIGEQYLFSGHTIDSANRSSSRQNYQSNSKDCIYANDSIDTNLALEDQPWFHGTLTRIKAEDLLSSSRFCEGSYLIRRSETSHDDYSLTIKRHGTYLHMKISRNPRGQYILGQYSQPYSSVPVMINHYSHSLLPIKGADSMTLQYPVYRQSASS